MWHLHKRRDHAFVFPWQDEKAIWLVLNVVCLDFGLLNQVVLAGQSAGGGILHIGGDDALLGEHDYLALDAVRGEALKLNDGWVGWHGHALGCLGHHLCNGMGGSGYIGIPPQGEGNRGGGLAGLGDLLERRGVKDGVGDQQLVTGPVDDDGMAPSHVADGSGGALDGDDVSRLDHLADHQSEAADDIGDCILQSEGERQTADAQGGDHCGWVDSEDGLQDGGSSKDPDQGADDVDEDGGTGQVGPFQGTSHGRRYNLGDQRSAYGHDDQKDDLSEVLTEPVDDGIAEAGDGLFGSSHGILVRIDACTGKVDGLVHQASSSDSLPALFVRGFSIHMCGHPSSWS